MNSLQISNKNETIITSNAKKKKKKKTKIFYLGTYSNNRPLRLNRICANL